MLALERHREKEGRVGNRELRRRASDPQTPLAELSQISADNVSIRRYVYANPQCPLSLRQWIEAESPQEAAAGEKIINDELHAQEKKEQRAAERAKAQEVRTNRTNNNSFSSTRPTSTKKKRGCLFYVVLIIVIYCVVKFGFPVVANIMNHFANSAHDSTGIQASSLVQHSVNVHSGMEFNCDEALSLSSL